MSEISPALQAKSSIFQSGYGLVSSAVLAGLLTIERNMAGRRQEAMLRGLDRRLLQDIGVELAPTVEIKSDCANRSGFAVLCEAFSWTRFAK